MIWSMTTACVLLLAAPADSFVHGWDTVTDMLGMNPHASGNGRYNDSPFAMKHWEWIANNYVRCNLAAAESAVMNGVRMRLLCTPLRMVVGGCGYLWLWTWL
jgi:hypothetical protein